MNRRKLTVYLLMIATICFMGAAHAAVTILKQDGVSTQGQLPLTPGPLLDDFNLGIKRNLWKDITDKAIKDGSGATLDVAYATDPSIVFGAGGRSLQLTYDVNNTESWVSYWSMLGGASLSGYNYVSFWVRSPNNNVLFKIQVRNNSADNDHNSSYVYVTDYLNGGITSTWKKVTIPLDAFANISDWTSMRDISIVFENTQSGWNGSPLNATVYIDNISFGKSFLGYVKLSNFGKKGPAPDTGNITNATGGQGNIIFSSGCAANAYASSTYYTSLPYSLQYNFSGVSGGDTRWVAYYMIIGGGANGFVESGHNYNRYYELAFQIRGATGNEYGIKAELKCAERSTYIFLKGIISSSWSQQRIPLVNFKTSDSNGTPTGTSVNPATLMKCSLTYDYWLYGWNPAHVNTGTIYIDDVQFETQNWAADITAPAKPGVPTASGIGNTVTLTSTASSGSTDPSMENVYFVYYDVSGAHAIAFDYNTEDTTYSVAWDVSGLPSGTYTIRSAAMDAWGNQTVSDAGSYTKP
jgi:hypothetical protein